jgi:hypothetical protein
VENKVLLAHLALLLQVVLTMLMQMMLLDLNSTLQQMQWVLTD